MKELKQLFKNNEELATVEKIDTYIEYLKQESKRLNDLEEKQNREYIDHLIHKYNTKVDRHIRDNEVTRHLLKDMLEIMKLDTLEKLTLSERRQLEQIRGLENKYGKAKAMSILAHKLGRAVYYMLKDKKAFNINKFLS